MVPIATAVCVCVYLIKALEEKKQLTFVCKSRI